MAWVAQMNLQIHEGENAIIKYLEGDGSLGFGKEVEGMSVDRQKTIEREDEYVPPASGKLTYFREPVPLWNRPARNPIWDIPDFHGPGSPISV